MKKLLGEELDPPPSDIHAPGYFFRIQQADAEAKTEMKVDEVWEAEKVLEPLAIHTLGQMAGRQKGKGRAEAGSSWM